MQSKLNKASEKAHVLDRETQETLRKVKTSNKRALILFVFSWSILLVVGVAGIYRQNEIAQDNKDHIDCIVKLLSTPVPKGQSRVITGFEKCNIVIK